MIEEIVIKYLEDKLNLPVFGEEQTDEIEKYVVIEQTGGNEENFICYATIAIQSYADTKYNASKLNESVKNAMRNIVELNSVSKCSLNSDYNFTDTTKKKYRYQAVYDLVFFND